MKDSEIEKLSKEVTSVSKEKDRLTKIILKMEAGCEKHLKELQSKKEMVETLKNNERELKELKEKNDKLEKKKYQYKKSERKLEKELMTLQKNLCFPKPTLARIPSFKKMKQSELNSVTSNKLFDKKNKNIERKALSKNMPYRLRVTNLEYSVTQNMLEDSFRPFGKITGFEVRLSEPATDLDSSDLQVHSNTGKGWVYFCKKEDAEKALKHANNLNLKGRTLSASLFIKH